MFEICKMTDAEFEEFVAISIEDHIRSQIRAGNWTEENAPGNMEQLLHQMLPDGMATPDHYFYSLRLDDDKNVGGLWFMVQSDHVGHFIFVVDIQVSKAFRRRGYGTQAFRFLEDKARNMGIDRIYLNVFEHNVTARWMYEKLGYAGEGGLMAKVLAPV